MMVGGAGEHQHLERASRGSSKHGKDKIERLKHLRSTPSPRR
jgi:hypothetical protein